MAENVGQNWHRLARLVIARRVHLGHRHQKDFAASSGLKIRTLNNIENARRTGYDASTIALLEQGLRWVPGSVDAILDGDEPTPVKSERRNEDDYVPTDEQIDDMLDYMLKARAQAPSPATVEKANQLIELLRAAKSDRTRGELLAYLRARRDYS